MKTILLILFFYSSISVFSQVKHSSIFNPELQYDGKRELKLEVINKSNLKCKLLYKQYYDSAQYAVSALNIGQCDFEDNIEPRFYFKVRRINCKEDLNPSWRSTFDILTITEDSCYVINDIIINTPPRYSSSIEVDSIFGCEIKIVLVMNGCIDTQTYNAIIKTEKGSLIFKDHANITLYANKSHTELYLLSIEECRNQFLLYKITK
jgi:hypothetical protein